MAISVAAKAGKLSEGYLKYIIYTEIPEENIEEVLNNQDVMSKCDSIALFYENEKEHIEFIKDNI